MPEPALWRDPLLPTHERVEALLAAMTREEKLAQLGSHWWSSTDTTAGPGRGEIAPLEHAFTAGRRTFEEATAHGLGHLTRVFGSEPVTPAAGVARLRARQRHLTFATRLGIPAIVHEECLTGFTTLGATVYPAPLAWAATFSPDLVQAMAEAIGRDMRAVGVHQGLSPVLDVVRDYRWGRVEETMGEDPYLVATLGTAYVRGLQSSGIIATLKHFAGYSAARAGRNHAPVPIGPREFADVILPPFEMAIREGGAGSVMNSYSDIDGRPAAAHAQLLTTTLREEWGFTGTVVSDYWAIAFLDMTHRVSPDRASSGALALHAGIDIELPATDAYARLRDADVSDALIERAARRVLTQKTQLGLLDPDWRPIPEPGIDRGPDPEPDLDSPANRALARRIAEKSVILLANPHDTLPLTAPPAHVALLGPCADDPRTFLGCYSFPNHVLSRYEEHGTGIRVDSLRTALHSELPDTRIEYAPGVPVRDPDTSGIPAAVEAARAADLCVLCVGDLASLFGRGTSGEGCDAPDLSLPGAQAQLVEAVLATGTPTVLVAVSGRPYALGPYADRCTAVVQAFLPGEEGGPAIASVLSGRVNPSGHLPVGIPRDPGGQPGTYLAPPLGRFSEGISSLDPTPLYPLGHGGSYTTFAFEDLALSAASIPADGTLTATLLVRNTGSREGEDVVQLYLSDEVAQVTRPVRELVGYARVRLAPGESCHVTFHLHADRTSFTGLDHHRIVEPGTFTLAVGHSAEDLPLTTRFEITGTGPRVIEGARVMTTPAEVRRA
ncbi:glycoside hydrolase family 3 N-terminal domain-containing protein [Streptomyces litchfieldiae]|uniref:Glycoside hydrolase family 3 N-terminal domain-containing protein n=1 Tax=Streptomyces litchfieldiae TaxID=3075543 RepID=A0ABU2MND8_9ACTN|nr:glycoside hydrolase family 3 N-terminal domain-containing protein [Streptomyces sp. DSM 44938]MDT0343127.1 glycoside hydrolase family 3 N-terminal domain-containing protein [Streptomyces sp. DSM 44938]